MKTVRILHVVSTLNSSAGDISVIMNYYRYINKEKVQFDFLYIRDSDVSYESEIYELGGRIYKIDSPNIKNIVNFRQYIQKYIELNNIHYQVVHFHELLLLSLIAPVLRRNGVKHVIAHSHSATYSYSKIRSIRNHLLCFRLKSFSNHLLACSKVSGEFWFGKKAMRDGHVTVINNAIDYDKFRFNRDLREDVRSQLDLRDRFVIGHVGRFSKEKNHSYLLDVFKEIIKYNSQSVLMLVGDGPLIEKIQAQAESLNISEFVIFLGQRNDVNMLYQAMDVFVFPSILEGLGMAAVEAQASGLPCVIADSITREVEISKAEFLSLNLSPNKWANVILNLDKARDDSTSQFIEKGFSIIEEAENLSLYYERILSRVDV